MNKIITLTLNPAVDKNSTVSSITPDNKLRCTTPNYEAGGGGINVSRAIKELGSESLSLYLGGGLTGEHLEQLLDKEGFPHKRINTEGWTRENFSVVDESNGKQYRFVMPGYQVSDKEMNSVLQELETTVSEGDYVVASGSLPPGIPLNFYGQVTELVNSKYARMILDTSGQPLLEGAKSGVFFTKA